MISHARLSAFGCTALLLAVLSAPLLAQRGETRPSPQGQGAPARGGRGGRGAGPMDTIMVRYQASEHMIPMRDGVKLYTTVLQPRGTAEKYPFIMQRTPYGIGNVDRVPNVAYADLMSDGYIMVFQDIRGRGKSEGQFVMLRPFRDKNDPRAIDESTDTYDTIDWLLKNIPNNNGRVGMHGGSYAGWTVVMAMLDPHPALKAAAPQASPSDMFIGDDFHHNGAFRLSYGFEYSTSMERPRDMQPIARDNPDVYQWYLNLGGLSSVNEKLLHRRIPTWNDFVDHPNYDEFWQRQSVEPYLTSVKVPTLNVAGWWDQEDFYGPITIYRKLEAHDTRNLNYLIVGPWNHGGWLRGTGQKFGPFDYGSATARFYLENVQKPWFAYWLKDRGRLNLPEALVFESGANAWRREDRWPARGTTPRKLYLHANGTASFTAPNETNTSGFDSYVSDPANPVPYRARSALANGRGSWSTWLWDDQRFLQGRSDVLSYMTEPLTEDLVVAGDITANLFVSTDKQDADFVVKLIDAHPETFPDSALKGYQHMVANDVFRSRFRNSYVTPEPMRPNQIERVTVDLHTQYYRFRKGHRVMVQIQSTWFPLIDRNPQKWVPNIFDAKDSDFESATHRVYRSAQAPTHIEIAVRRNK